MARGRNLGGPRGRKRKRSQVQRPSKIGWSDLPMELREIILEDLEDSLQGGKAASYASVSKEWNRILEPGIFKRLELSENRLREFKNYVTDRRRPFVQYIWFRFKRSLCPGMSLASVEYQHVVDHATFGYAVYSLFHMLSEWEERKTGQPGIVLELSAFSGSDPCHSMKDTVPKQLENVDVTEDSDALNAMYEKSPVRQMRGLSREETTNRRMLGGFYGLDRVSSVLEVPFPTVKLVTDLTVRRQMLAASLHNTWGVWSKHSPGLSSSHSSRQAVPFCGRMAGDQTGIYNL